MFKYVGMVIMSLHFYNAEISVVDRVHDSQAYTWLSKQFVKTVSEAVWFYL